MQNDKIQPIKADSDVIQIVDDRTLFDDTLMSKVFGNRERT
ncbi:hypothetical protein CIY_22300 [Butyrivibrio fibrisolvens 16/4]|nr:hypothetical protein CIY_22300 [Butyrivibrio fibrisolvens 16/4]